MSPVEVRTLTEPEVADYQVMLESAFGGDPDPDELASWRPLVEVDRTLGAFDGTYLVGSAAAFTFDMTVPGGPVPCAGVTGVSVRPTHRRQGALRALMRHQLGEIRERGAEAFASLWASEASIYGRFGYGVAGRRWVATVASSDPDLLGRPPTGAVRAVDVDEFRALASPVHDAARLDRPGMVSRSPARWTTRLADLPAHRAGASTRRHVVYERDGACRGYAAYRTKGEWTDSGPNGTVRVMELVALDADAHGALWRFLLGIDLMRTVSYDNLPPDDPLPARLRDPRRLRGSVSDGLYVRLLDVPRALTSRSYAAPARAVVEVVDEFGGWAAGRWLLDVSPEGANCVPTTESADVTLGAAELGATHLGDTTLRVLYGAGRVDEHTAGTVAALSRAFAGDRAAWCPEIF